MIKKILILGFLTLGLSSCLKDKFDFNKTNEIKLSSEWWVPFAEVELNVSDIKLDTNFIKTDSEGFVSILYRIDSVLDAPLPPFISIPDQEPLPLPLTVGGGAIGIQTSLGTFGGAELLNVIFDTLRLNFSFDSNVPNGVEVELSFLGFTVGGAPYSFTLQTSNSLPAGQTHTIELTDVLFDLSNNGTGSNTLGVSAEVTEAGILAPNDPVSVSINLSKLVPRQINGFIGTRTVDIPAFSFPLNLGGIERFADGLFLDNPIIRFEFFNGAGVPFQINPSIAGITSTNNVVILELPSMNFAQAPQAGTTGATFIQLDKNNTNIPDFISSLPRILTLAGNLKTNPQGQVGPANFVSASEKVIGNLELELPMQFSAKNMVYEQRLNNVAIWDDNADFIESLTLGINSENGFPFNIKVQAIFIDSISNQPIDSILINIMDPATINANGRVIQSVKYLSEVVLDQEKIANLLRSRDLVIRASLNTPDEGNAQIKIYDDYFFKSKLSLKAKINYEPFKNND